MCSSQLWSIGSFCRQVHVDMLVNNSAKLGGVGVVVEIDESKFGKRKYHRVSGWM
ncbi:hypothetical protein AVEN_191938-1, partial [Araneus ventricosus]